MEIQQGKGPWASPVNGIVPLGTTLTMVVGIDDKEGKYEYVIRLNKKQIISKQYDVEDLHVCYKENILLANKFLQNSVFSFFAKSINLFLRLKAFLH